jgi:hypothetical protein
MNPVWKRILRAALPLAAVPIAAAVALARPVHADGVDPAERAERCATRLSIAFLGKAPSPQLQAAANPQDQVDALLADPEFQDRFARFVNAQFNPEPGANVPEDASYTLAKYVMVNQKPWKEMFVGKYAVDATVTDDPNGLGYFRSAAWMRRYAGNELAGYRITAAYRILQNTTGLQLLATTAVDGLDLSANGRQAPACKGCHYESWYALDKVAKVLSRRKGTGTNMTFTAPTEGPQQILDGKTISNDAELVQALVESEDFRFNVCRLAFTFLYGRDEYTCEADVFDRCVDAFTKTGTMHSAIAAIAKDATYCQ